MGVTYEILTYKLSHDRISVASMTISLPRTNSIRTQAVEMARTHRNRLGGTRYQILRWLVRHYRRL